MFGECCVDQMVQSVNGVSASGSVLSCPSVLWHKLIKVVVLGIGSKTKGDREYWKE